MREGGYRRFLIPPPIAYQEGAVEGPVSRLRFSLHGDQGCVCLLVVSREYNPYVIPIQYMSSFTTSHQEDDLWIAGRHSV